jgi:ketosteroid isomerase-like protein
MKPVLLIFIGLWLISGCAVKDDTTKNVAIAHAMFDAFNTHDWQKMASYYSEDAIFLDPSYGTDYVTKTRSDLVAKYEALEKLFPDIHDQIVGTYLSGDKVTVEFISTGTVSDTINFKLPIIAVLTFKNGLIVKDATYYDLENP